MCGKASVWRWQPCSADPLLTVPARVGGSVIVVEGGPVVESAVFCPCRGGEGPRRWRRRTPTAPGFPRFPWPVHPTCSSWCSVPSTPDGTLHGEEGWWRCSKR